MSFICRSASVASSPLFPQIPYKHSELFIVPQDYGFFYLSLVSSMQSVSLKCPSPWVPLKIQLKYYLLWRRKWQLTAVLLPEKPPGQRGLVSYGPFSHKRVGQDWATEQQQFAFPWDFLWAVQLSFWFLVVFAGVSEVSDAFVCFSYTN